MITTKIQIRNLFGIKEYTQDGGSVELSGKNGVGKTSVIDAIRFALTNKSERFIKGSDNKPLRRNIEKRICKETRFD